MRTPFIDLLNRLGPTSGLPRAGNSFSPRALPSRSLTFLFTIPRAQTLGVDQTLGELHVGNAHGSLHEICSDMHHRSSRWSSLLWGTSGNDFGGKGSGRFEPENACWPRIFRGRKVAKADPLVFNVAHAQMAGDERAQGTRPAGRGECR